MSGDDQFLKHLNRPWASVKQVPVLKRKETHVWRASLEASSAQLEQYWKTLSEDEKERSSRFKFEQGCDQYISGRGMLRSFLGSYLSVKPATIQFNYNAYGKPLLSKNEALQFNLSHSAGVVLYAFTLGASIGVDIELIKTNINVSKLAARFFAKKESTFIQSLPEAKQHEAFFKCWTRKESFIKAHGKGLSMPLDQFEVSIRDSDVVAIRSIEWNQAEVKEWSMRSFWVGDDKVGAVVVRSGIDEISLLESLF